MIIFERVAAVVDKFGGLRVLAGDPETFDQHLVEENEDRLFLVPDLYVTTPIPWDDIPEVIEKAQKHVVKTLAPTNHCGECTACCFTLYIDDGPFKKPSNTWCNNCADGFGCKVYQQRPKACRSFKCEWLLSQERNDKMIAALRPDRCGAIFTSDRTNHDPLIIECHGTPDQHAWAWINEMQRVGYKVREITRYYGEGDKP